MWKRKRILRRVFGSYSSRKIKDLTCSGLGETFPEALLPLLPGDFPCVYLSIYVLCVQYFSGGEDHKRSSIRQGKPVVRHTCPGSSRSYYLPALSYFLSSFPLPSDYSIIPKDVINT